MDMCIPFERCLKRINTEPSHQRFEKFVDYLKKTDVDKSETYSETCGVMICRFFHEQVVDRIRVVWAALVFTIGTTLIYSTRILECLAECVVCLSPTKLLQAIKIGIIGGVEVTAILVNSLMLVFNPKYKINTNYYEHAKPKILANNCLTIRLVAPIYGISTITQRLISATEFFLLTPLAANSTSYFQKGYRKIFGFAKEDVKSICHIALDIFCNIWKLQYDTQEKS